MTKILITGGAGFIGSHVVDAAVARYPQSEIIVLDKMNYAANVHFIFDHLRSGRVKLVVADIGDYEGMLRATHGVKLLLNLAAESHVGRSFNNSMEFTRTNTLGTHVLLEAARQQGVERFVHVSTDEVYGEVLEEAATEKHPLHPNNPYSGSKAAAEMIIQSYWRSFGSASIIVRANNIFGMRQYPEKIIPKFIVQGLSGKSMALHGDGTYRRHYLAAQDFARALLLIAENGELCSAYNVGGTEEYENRTIAKMICAELGLDPEKSIRFERDRPFNDRRYAVDDSRVRLMGWMPEIKLKNALPDLVAWYRRHHNLFSGDSELEHEHVPLFEAGNAAAAARRQGTR
jgi:UDP-glucose 4,6-dehydratase